MEMAQATVANGTFVLVAVASPENDVEDDNDEYDDTKTLFQCNKFAMTNRNAMASGLRRQCNDLVDGDACVDGRGRCHDTDDIAIAVRR